VKTKLAVLEDNDFARQIYLRNTRENQTR